VSSIFRADDLSVLWPIRNALNQHAADQVMGRISHQPDAELLTHPRIATVRTNDQARCPVEPSRAMAERDSGQCARGDHNILDAPQEPGTGGLGLGCHYAAHGRVAHTKPPRYPRHEV